MNFLPAAKLAAHAKDFLANLASGEKKAPAGQQKTVPGVKESSGQGAGFAEILRRAEAAGHTSDRNSAPDIRERVASAAKNIPASSNTNTVPSTAGEATNLSDMFRRAGEEGRKRNEVMPSLAQGRGGKSGQPPENAAQKSVHDWDARQSVDLFAGNKDLDARQQYTPLEKAPTVPHSVNGVHYQLGEVGFTQRELVKLRDALLGEGLSPQSLTVIEQLASHPHGATLGQLLTLMQGNLLRQTSLSEEDSQLLQHLAAKIDPSGELGKKLPQLLENGRLKDAWDAIKSSLAAANPTAYPVFEAGDAALLCKLFGISEQTSQAVLKQFGNADALPLTPDIFTALMLPAQEEILHKVQQDDKLGQALAKHLQPIIAEARLRGEKERKAAEGADRKSKQTEVLIRDKATNAIRKDVFTPEKDETRKDEAGHALGRTPETQAKNATQDLRDAARPEAQAGRTPLTYEDALAAQDTHSAAVTAKTPEAAPAPKAPAPSGQGTANRAETDAGHTPSRHDQDRGGADNRDARNDARSELFARVEIRPNAPGAGTHAAFAMPAQPQEQAAGHHISNPAPLIRQALRQVEQGTLNKLAGGEQRLELQLAPSELGAVTLILTSGKSGEISATIRSERSETAELVARHLDMIRVSLEEQGLKVDKLEVQNQMLNQRDDWQGMEQHNAMRDGQERREQLERLRRLGRLGDAPQARDVQLHEHTAEISGHGLHLVA